MNRTVNYIKNSLLKLASEFYQRRVLWIWLWAMSVCGILDIIRITNYGYSSIWSICYLIFVGAFKSSIALAILIPLVGSGRRILRWSGWIGFALFSFLSLMNVCAISFYQMPISGTLFRTFIETNSREVLEFIGELSHNLLSIFISPFPYLAIVTATTIIWTTRKIKKKAWLGFVAATSLIGVGMFAQYCFTYICGRTAHSIFYRTARSVNDIYQAQTRLNEIAKSLPQLPHAKSIGSQHLASTLVMVLGESASSSHLSTYGYPLPTSPCFDAMRDSLFIFTDAISSAPSTSENIDRILSLKRDDQNTANPFIFPRMIDIFNHAGYKTFWISNQERSGLMANNTTVFTSEASAVDYVGAESSEDHSFTHFDDRVLPGFNSALTDTAPNKMIFTHLMGSHMEYRKRYPVSHSVFSFHDELKAHKKSRPWLKKDGASVMAHYDNSIHYTDSILGQMIHRVALLSTPAAFIYFSDHGENVYDEGNRTGRGIKYVRVPFVIYLNRAYRDANPEMVKRLETARHLPFSTANIVHSLMTLSGTSYKLYDGTIDVLSPAFRPRVRYVDNAPWPFDTIPATRKTIRNL